jgi:hypothetical protein
MDETKEDALLAAMLAKQVGSELSKIDNLSGDRKIQANRLDINNFISNVVSAGNPNRKPLSNGYPMQPPPGISAPLSEDIIQRMIPDPPKREPTPTIDNNTTSTISSEKVEVLLKSIDDNLKILVSFIKNG